MEQIIAFFTNNEKVVWAIMALAIFGIIYLLKIPYKKLTSKITNEKGRQIANKAIVLLTFAVSIGLTLGYSYLVKVDFSITDSIKYAVSAIALYSATEVKKGNTDVAFMTEEGKEVVETVIQSAIAVEEKKQKTKKKKKEEETTEAEADDSAIAIFKSAMGQNK